MSAEVKPSEMIKLALPKGRMERGVNSLLSEAGIEIKVGSRAYRPHISLAGFEVKVLKPQNIVEMLHVGSRDIGFAGADWVSELGVELVELINTKLDPVRVVAAAPSALLENGKLPKRPILIASEYENLTARWIKAKGLDAKFVRSYGATEVFPPEDADCIVDNCATGSTLRANGLDIVDELMASSTCLYANPRILEKGPQRDAIEALVLILKSVLDARERVMLEVNVDRPNFDAVIGVLPCMRHPTISPLHGDLGYAVKVAVRRDLLPSLIPQIKALGGTDIVVTPIAQLVA